MRGMKLFCLVGALLLLPLSATAAEVEVYNPAGVRTDGKHVDFFIRKSMDEQKITVPPLSNRFTPGTTEKIQVKDNAETEINRLFLLRGWSDGLPIILPTPERVEKMLEGTDYAPEDVIATLKPLDGQATVEKLAVNAVMAGCRPEHFPFLIAAVSALTSNGFDQLGPATTTGYETHMMLISGPAARQIDLNSGTGTLGRGVHGNAALGRAFHLAVQNIGGSVPGVTDMSNHGNPGEFAMCAVENNDANPWSPIHMTEGYPELSNVVNVAAVGSVVQIIHIGITNEELLDRVALAMTPHLKWRPAGIWLMPPDTAKELFKAGYTIDSLIAEINRRLGPDKAPSEIKIMVTGGPGEKNLVLEGWYAMKNLTHKEVELPAMWDTLVEEARADLTPGR